VKERFWDVDVLAGDYGKAERQGCGISTTGDLLAALARQIERHDEAGQIELRAKSLEDGTVLSYDSNSLISTVTPPDFPHHEPWLPIGWSFAREESVDALLDHHWVEDRAKRRALAAFLMEEADRGMTAMVSARLYARFGWNAVRELAYLLDGEPRGAQGERL
jgi:hypothetical protein